MNYNTTVPALLFFVLVSSLGAESGRQSTTGTVVVSGGSLAKIVIAVDSRGFDDNAKYRDDICKIVRLDDHSVFTAAGNIIHAHAGQALWNAQTEASNSFKQAQKTASPRLLKTASKNWGDHMVASINKALSVDPSGSKLMIEHDIFLTGVFLGFENVFTASYKVEIPFHPATRQAKQNFYTEHHRRTIQFAALGRNAIVTEVVADKTHFAKVEQRKWTASERNIPLRDRDVRWAIRLVQLTMEYHPKKIEVGGPIDALQITRKGIRWLQRKPECNP